MAILIITRHLNQQSWNPLQLIQPNCLQIQYIFYLIKNQIRGDIIHIKVNYKLCTNQLRTCYSTKIKPLQGFWQCATEKLRINTMRYLLSSV